MKNLELLTQWELAAYNHERSLLDRFTRDGIHLLSVSWCPDLTYFTYENSHGAVCTETIRNFEWEQFISTVK